MCIHFCIGHRLAGLCTSSHFYLVAQNNLLSTIPVAVDCSSYMWTWYAMDRPLSSFFVKCRSALLFNCPVKFLEKPFERASMYLYLTGFALVLGGE
ncbi:hypothetical protein P8452_22616 [Trifolium repens]|nr:hypothetical protein P8452_22616 [Trifolium repens]